MITDRRNGYFAPIEEQVDLEKAVAFSDRRHA